MNSIFEKVEVAEKKLELLGLANNKKRENSTQKMR